MSVESVMPFNHLILCYPLLLLPSILMFPSIRVFSNEPVLCIEVAEVLELQLQHQSFQWIFMTDFFFFYMNLLDLLAGQGTLKSHLQQHSSKASILWYSVFFIVQLSHPYMTTIILINLTRCKFVGKVMSLLFNMLSKLFITFLPRSNNLLISWSFNLIS